MRILLLCLLSVACAPVRPIAPEPREPKPTPPKPYQWILPTSFPVPKVPEDNPMSEVKVELGRRLFYDQRLSANKTQACASCHKQELAFTDGKIHAIGSTGAAHRRNAQSLANAAYNATYTWANTSLTTLEAQALVPFLNKEPIELDLVGNGEELIKRLSADREYQRMFREAFPTEPISMSAITKALSCFERTLLSGNSPFDQFIYQGKKDALSDSAKRGMKLFFSERLECDHCHSGFNFSDATSHEKTTQTRSPFHNNGLYNEDGAGAYPKIDQGLYEITLAPNDIGKFRAPSLRNIAVTAPYMHDGSLATLEEVIDQYAAGGNARKKNKGKASPLQSSFIRGFTLSKKEKEDLIAFLRSLTDQSFLTDPRFSDPFISNKD